MHTDALKRLQLETDMRKALDLGEFQVYYQPVVSLQQWSDCGFEALSRWHRPHGIVMPGEFIAVANEIGIISPSIANCFGMLASSFGPGMSSFLPIPPLSLGVNVSPKQFAQPDLASRDWTV